MPVVTQLAATNHAQPRQTQRSAGARGENLGGQQNPNNVERREGRHRGVESAFPGQ